MSEEQQQAIQTACDLRFELLSLLGERGPDMLRDFEEALANVRPSRVTFADWQHSDKRSRELALAERELALVKGSLAEVSSEQLPGYLETISHHVQKRDAALALPEHEYECWECGEAFHSAARRVLFLTGDVDHDEEGTVIRARRFRNPVAMIICADCKSKMKIGEYLQLPPPLTAEQIAAITARNMEQRNKPRVRE